MSQFLRCFSAPCVAISATDHTRLLTILGSRAGAPVRRWGDTVDVPEPPPLGRWHARQHGLDLHAGIVMPAES